jgi:hypothetical protein
VKVANAARKKRNVARNIKGAANIVAVAQRSSHFIFSFSK